MSVSFRFDWVDSGKSLDSAARRTMAALTIEVGNSTVTSLLDKRNRVYRRHVVVPMVQVAEWLVAHWWHLWNEIPDSGQQRLGFAARHNLGFAGDGFVLPRLEMAPVSGRVRMRWTRWKARYAPIEFVEEAEARVERPELEAELREIINAVIERLRRFSSCAGAESSLAEAWDAINSVNSDELEFCRAAALLGLDPFDVQDPEATAIASFWDQVDPSIREEALASATGDTLLDLSSWLRNTAASLDRVRTGTAWSAIRREMRPAGTPKPWMQGYELARAVRREVGITDGRFEFPSDGPLAIHHQEVATPPSSRIHGFVAANTPACAIAAKTAHGLRFLRARALGDHLSRKEPSPGILSSLVTDRQARSVAFAAEFLAPAESLRARLGTGVADEEMIDCLGDEFGVSSFVIQHQIKNHNLAVPVLSGVPLH